MKRINVVQRASVRWCQQFGLSRDIFFSFSNRAHMDSLAGDLKQYILQFLDYDDVPNLRLLNKTWLRLYRKRSKVIHELHRSSMFSYLFVDGVIRKISQSANHQRDRIRVIIIYSHICLTKYKSWLVFWSHSNQCIWSVPSLPGHQNTRSNCCQSD